MAVNMNRMISTNTKKTQLSGMLGTKDLTDWETEFVESILKRDFLTEKQLEILDRIWKKHFAG
jgi:hypothetical protein